MARDETTHPGNATVTAKLIEGLGYAAQAKHDLDDELSRDEERLLRKIDAMTLRPGTAESTGNHLTIAADQRWIAIARTHIQEGFMALRRAIYQPARIRLPEDVP